MVRCVIAVCVATVLGINACASNSPYDGAAAAALVLFLSSLMIVALMLRPWLSEFLETGLSDVRRRMRFSVRRMMYVVAAFALVFWTARYMCQPPSDPNQPDYHGMMAFFCEEEAKLFHDRADACRARAKKGEPWDEPGEEAEILKICPYPSDQRHRDSWFEQAAIWERASDRAWRGAERHRSRW
jgi:hypothetical protein